MVGVTIGIYLAARLGLAARITDDVRAVTGRDPIAFATFAQDYAEAWAGH
jgi:hypothetical protein